MKIKIQTYICSADYDATLPCQCNDKCPQYGNCCPDYDDFCDNGGGGGTQIYHIFFIVDSWHIYF